MHTDITRIQILFRSSAILTCFVSLAMIVPAIALMFNVPVMGWMIPFAFLLGVLIVALAAKSGSAKITLYACGIALVSLVLCTLICGAFFDFSYDGNTHHKEAVVFLAQGWNPLRESVANWRGFQELYPNGSMIQLWIDHYAHGPWLFGAAMYDLTGWIETGKSYTLISMVAAGCMLGAMLSGRGFPGWQCVLLALLAAVNPITVPQFITFYNDAFLMMSLFAVLLSLYIVALRKNSLQNDVISEVSVPSDSAFRISLLVFAFAFISCVQAKFTGLAYAGLFSVAFLVVYAVQAAKSRKGCIDGGADSCTRAAEITSAEIDADKIAQDCKNFALKRFLLMGILMLSTLIVSVCVVGYSPYITNFLNAGHPFYPLMGEGAVDIMTANSPAIFANMNTLQKEFVSLFSPLASPEVTDNYELALKLPLSISFSELRQMPANDSRISGFGLLYSAIAIVNFICVIPMLIISRKRWNVFFMGCVAYYACVVALVFIFSDGWWARYSGYRYFSSIILLAFMFKLLNERNCHIINYRIVKPVAVLFAALLVANTALFLVLNTSVQYVRSCALNSQLMQLKQEVDNGAELHLASENQELGLLFNLDSMGARYIYDGPVTEDFAPTGATHRFLYRLD
ncbi:hypothetical protein [Adlercreutzia sp. ZJ154]|uniref:hypothetical protein n=1 Tax=Adlercreutzia sp. ZJ154 TaxID=2709790 RepID=UPI0013EDE82E|nr:hypothetical protein [Adlercreutzia sp. ZJ154]